MLRDGQVREDYVICYEKDGKNTMLRFTLVYVPSPHALPVLMQVDPFSTNPLFISRVMSYNADERFPMYDFALRGFAAVNVEVGYLSYDDIRRCRLDMLSLYPPQKGNGWSTISVWAWGMSRVVDFIYSDSRFDGKRIIIEGFSRAGKTALWAAAQDERIAGVFACNSGCMGSALHRGKTGERISDITRKYPYWSCDNFKKYADREEELPMDQHMLLALIAPRPLYVTSASEDDWSCPEKEFEACVLADEVYRALGTAGLESHVFPPPEVPLDRGRIGYHIRRGQHSLRTYDWDRVIPFMRRELGI